MSPRDREKIVLRPAAFRPGDIVQTLVEGVRFEIVRVKTGEPARGPMTHLARPAWTEELACPYDRDHVVVREPPRAEEAVIHPDTARLHDIAVAVEKWKAEPDGEEFDRRLIRTVGEILERRS